MRNYNLRLEEYGISKELYHELRYFCLQYPRKKEQLDTLRAGFNNFEQDGMPRGTDISNPTEKRAMHTLEHQYREDLEVIEQSAIMADAKIYSQLIENVTRGTCWEKLSVPCGINQFYQARREFFYTLAVRLNKIEH